jgi:hypothetical protein
MAKSKLTPKENFLRLTRGEIPENIPIFTMGFPGPEVPVILVGPSLFNETHIPAAPAGRYKDIWGVDYIANEETNFACIPEPNNFMLEDITKWPEVVKKPVMPDNIDWEKLAKADLEASGIDRTNQAAMGVIGLMPFQQAIAFMGFNNGLMAIYEEPEAFEELINFMVDAYMPIVQATVDYYDPDMMYLLDDTASGFSPFISPDTYRNVLKPAYARLTKPAVDRGIPIHFHNCGKCEEFVDDMIEFGVKSWDPAQAMNDLGAVKKKYGRQIAIVGGYNWVPPVTYPDVREEDVRQTVRDCIDKYAPGGGYAFFGAALGRYGDQTVVKVNEWIANEAYNYGRDYYLK